jgi:hypothetical protein
MQNTMEAVIVHPNTPLPTAMMANDKQVRTLIRSIVNWRNKMLERPKPERFLCLDCETAFHDRRRPKAFAVAVSLLGNGRQAWTIGICKHCVDKGDAALLQKVRGAVADVLPGPDACRGWSRLSLCRSHEGGAAGWRELRGRGGAARRGAAARAAAWLVWSFAVAKQHCAPTGFCCGGVSVF